MGVMEEESFSVAIESEIIPSSIVATSDNEQEALIEQNIPSSIAAECDGHLQVIRTPEQHTRSRFVVKLPTVSSHAFATPMGQQEFLQNIVDSVTTKFSELACTLRYDGLDSSNPY